MFKKHYVTMYKMEFYGFMVRGIFMETKKNSSSILITISWICVALLTFNVIPPTLMFVPICIGIVLRRDYQENKQGLALIHSGTGWNWWDWQRVLPTA